jgi:hypothetical protein
MTDKDREAFEALFGKRDKYFSTNVIWDSAWKAWQAATAAERERCAKVCETFGADPWAVSKECADKIRSGE